MFGSHVTFWELRSSSFIKINGDCHYERDRHIKYVVGLIIKWVSLSLIIFKIFVSLSLQMEEIEKSLNGEDLNSLFQHHRSIK